MVPKVVDIRETVPKTLSGKVSRRELRALAAAQTEGPAA
jgi:acyl-coenzyme A synthetase/AMP-(fatty) acid ligase